MNSLGTSSSTTTATISPNSSDQGSVEDLKPGGIGLTGHLRPAASFVQSYFQGEMNARIVIKEREMNPATMDHSYSKSWSAHPFASKTLPTRTLFYSYPNRHCDTLNRCGQEDDVLDVEAGSTLLTVATYDAMKSRLAMGECERYVASTLAISGYDENGCRATDNDGDDWDERVSKTNWSYSQHRLFTRATRIMHSDRLARLTHEGASNEPVMRRIAVDKSAKRMRQLLGSFNWDSSVTQWLHTIFMDHLSASYLSAYLDILQVLKSKVPALVDNMMAIPPPGKSIASSGSSSSVNDSLAQLLKRPWDPTSVVYTQKLKKLPSSPLIVIAPFGPSPSAVNQLRRMRFWNSQFSSLGKIVPVTMHSVNGGRNQQISECLESMLSATRNKVSELRTSFPSRPIVLVGWSIGALVACHIALAERLAAVVCLGFPSNGITGARGEVDDPLLEIKAPTLFVLGQMSTLSNIDDVEDMREKMKVETGLVVVGGADELLRVSHKKKRLEGVTQSMVDRHIMEEVSNFLVSVLSGVVHESSDVSGRGIASSSSSFIVLGSTALVKETQKRRKRKSTALEDEELTEVRQTPNRGKPSMEKKKGFKQLDLFSNPDVCGVQQSPLISSLTSPPLDTGLKIIGRRNYGTVRAASSKKTKFNPIVTPVESSSSTSDSSNNSLPGGSVATPWDNTNRQQETAQIPATSPGNNKFQSLASASGGITVSIGAMSSLGHLRTSVTTSTPHKSTATAMTSLVNKTSPPKTVSAVTTLTSDHASSPPPAVFVQQGAQRSLPVFTRSLPITIHSVPVRSAFSVPRTGVQSTLSSLMTYALGSKGGTLGASTSTTTSTSPSSTSLLFTNKAGAFETIRQAGRLIVCKSSETANREMFLDQVQAIQKMQFHDFPLTTASLTRASGSPIITQAKILTSRGLDLKKLQTLSTSIAGQLTGGNGGSDAANATSTSTATSTMPSLLIATGGGGKPLFVSGSAVNLAKMCQSVGAETAGSIDAGSSAAAQSVLDHAKRANPLLNFTVSSVKLHIPERRSVPSSKSSATSGGSPKVSFIMLSSNTSPRTQKIEKPPIEETPEEQVLDVNEDAALLLDLARSAPAADVSGTWQHPQPVPLEIPLQPSSAPIVINIPVDEIDIAPLSSLKVADYAPPSEVLVGESVEELLVAESTGAVQGAAETKRPPPPEEITILDSETDDVESIGFKEPEIQVKEEEQQQVDADVVAASSSKGSRSKPPPFPTIAATRTRRVRVPKYMYYEV